MDISRDSSSDEDQEEEDEEDDLPYIFKYVPKPKTSKTVSEGSAGLKGSKTDILT